MYRVPVGLAVPEQMMKIRRKYAQRQEEFLSRCRGIKVMNTYPTSATAGAEQMRCVDGDLRKLLANFILKLLRR